MTEHEPKHIVFSSPVLNTNALGRVYALWLLAQELGWTAEVLSVMDGEIWAPVQGTEFADQCHFLSGTPAQQRAAWREAAARADAVVTVKPYMESFGEGFRAAKAENTPLLADIDDPDYETRFTWSRKRGVIKRRLLRDRLSRSLAQAHRGIFTVDRIVSNPELQKIYSGSVIPHARQLPPEVAPHESREPVVAFVGTPRAHKGIDTLRAAVSELAGEGFTLRVTADAPDDAKPWEDWMGGVPFEDAMQVLASSDIVVIPSPRDNWSRAQLPAKLTDAMVFGRAVLVSDVGPLPWAVGDGGLTVQPSHVGELTESLASLADPLRRGEFGAAARRRAEEAFSTQTVAQDFARAVKAARVPSGPWSP